MSKETDALLLSKLRDGLSISRKRPYFMGFLDEREAAVCEDALARDGQAGFLLWGGYEEAERKIAGLFPDYLEPDASLFPLVPLTFTFRKEDTLSHRDFLGAFMALGVERHVVGDILVGKGRCVAFVRQEMESYFCQNINKVGRVGVRAAPGAEDPLPLEKEYLALSGVVASQRLDCFVAFLCRVSREKAAGLITSGLVMRNHRETFSLSEHVDEGDLISVRKQGKFIIDRIGPLTAKGRLSVQCRKYK